MKTDNWKEENECARLYKQPLKAFLLNIKPEVFLLFKILLNVIFCNKKKHFL